MTSMRATIPCPPSPSILSQVESACSRGAREAETIGLPRQPQTSASPLFSIANESRSHYQAREGEAPVPQAVRPEGRAAPRHGNQKTIHG